MASSVEELTAKLAKTLNLALHTSSEHERDACISGVTRIVANNSQQLLDGPFKGFLPSKSSLGRLEQQSQEIIRLTAENLRLAQELHTLNDGLQSRPKQRQRTEAEGLLRQEVIRLEKKLNEKSSVEELSAPTSKLAKYLPNTKGVKRRTYETIERQLNLMVKYVNKIDETPEMTPEELEQEIKRIWKINGKKQCADFFGIRDMNNYLRAKSGKVHSGNRDVGSIPHYMKILRLINYDDVSKIIYNDEECKEIDKILSQNSQYEG